MPIETLPEVDSDNELVRRLATDGDTRALKLLIDKYSHMVTHYLNWSFFLVEPSRVEELCELVRNHGHRYDK
jgi:hypothetical protein